LQIQVHRPTIKLVRIDRESDDEEDDIIYEDDVDWYRYLDTNMLSTTDHQSELNGML
jgi:hypothetical protein